MSSPGVEEVVRGLQSTVGTMQESMGTAMAGVAVNMERSMSMMETMNTVMEQYLVQSVRPGAKCFFASLDMLLTCSLFFLQCSSAASLVGNQPSD